MKKLLVLLIAVAMVTACAKKETVNETSDPFNGYSKYLKSGEQMHTLWAGQHIDIGTATYGVDENANFYVTYDCSASGWTMSETHMFCGDKRLMPVNKPGNPKVGRFPNSEDHNPAVSIYTYTVPLVDLPPAEEPGFTVACHAAVHGPNGESETAWAEGEFTFTDKGWGWYDTYYYNQPENPFTILYGTEHSDDSLKLYMLDMTNGGATLIFTEYVGNAAGSYDGTAYDLVSGNFFFTNYVTDELFVNPLKDDDPSYSAGTLDGKAASATFYEGDFYYVSEDENTINQVTFNADWTIAEEYVLSTIPNSVSITDIAFSPTGDKIFMVGDLTDGTTQMISWEVETDTYATIGLTINEDTQIAYGSDGLLYAISPIGDGGNGTGSYIIDTDTGIVDEINDDDIIIIDPFSDLSTGPIM